MQSDERGFGPWSGPLLAAALGFCLFFYYFDPRILDPTRVDWVSTSDRATNFLGWHFFRHEPWSWPPGLLRGYASGVGASVAITDSIPLVAFLLKPLDALLPPDFNYLGWWIVLCFALQGFFSCRLLQALGVRGARAIAGAALLTVLPFMAARATVHIPLASHWLFTAALWIYFDATRDPTRFARWIALLPVAAFVNPYLFVTISPVFAANALALLWQGEAAGRRAVLARGAIAVALSALALYCMGFGTVSVANTWGFYGQLQVNLLAWINSLGVGSLLPPIPVAEAGQTEPSMYLGVGGLVVLGLGALLLAISRPRLARMHWPLVVALALLLAAAISHRVALGPWFLVDLHPLPQRLQDLLNPFRSSGRLAWLPTYLVMALAIAGVARMPRGAVAILVAAVALNLVDGRAVRAAGQSMVDRASTQGTPDCSALPRGLDRVEFVPQVTLEDYSTAGAWPVALCAGRQAEPMNVGALARTDLGRFNASAQKAAKVLEGSPERNVAYVYANPATGLALGAGAAPVMGAYHVFVPGSASAGTAMDAAWNWPLDIAIDLTGRARHILLWGWSVPMHGSVRSYRDRVAILLPVPPGETREAVLKLLARAAPPGSAGLSAEVSANGTPLGKIAIRDPTPWQVVRIPASVIAASRGALRVELALAPPAPLEQPRSFPDDRLRLSLERVVIAAVDPRVVAGEIRAGSDDARFLGSGWSVPEPWGVWSDGKVATLRMRAPEGTGDARLRVLAHAISATGRQDVRVSVAGREVAQCSFASQQSAETREATIPAALVPTGREVEIAFEIAHPGPPPASADKRDLGIGLLDFELARR